jgi:pSer/pThr/pTyr-binding forkhead associated (FHA) protein
MVGSIRLVAQAPREPPLTSPAELKQRLDAERAGLSFLVYRDGAGQQRLFALDAGRDRATVGRAHGTDVTLDWDSEVSRAHAELQRVGAEWAVVDDGLSRNGTFVNGERVHGRRRLEDHDVLRVGDTELTYRASTDGDLRTTIAAPERPAVALSDTQRRVLIALCRPYRDPGPFAQPSTNQQIAEEVFLGVDAVKSHMRALFQKFAVEDLPHNRKRARLVELALQSGAISARDLE